MTALASLVGARIRRVDVPEPALLALSLYQPELRSVLVLRVAGENAGVGLVAQRPQGQPANSFVQKLRKELENARIVEFGQRDKLTLSIVTLRSEVTTLLLCDFGQGAIWLERAGKTLIRSTARTSGKRPAAIAWPEQMDDLHEAGEGLVADQALASLDARRHALERVLRAARKRLQRRMQALQQDRERALLAEPLRLRANLLLTQQHLVRRGQASVRLINYSADPPAEVEVELDPTRSVQEQIEGWFKQAKRFERGADMAAQRSALTSRELAQLDQLLAALPSAGEEELLALADQARALGLGGVGQALRASADAAPKPAARQVHKPYRQFVGWKERTILVGKNASDNDVLTREHARPQDLWLHARGQAGAHVVVPLARNEACPEELLLDAAHLAAHFSGARSEPVVEVSYTGKRYVRKPRGAAVGQVVLERERVLALHLEPARLSRLLANERVD